MKALNWVIGTLLTISIILNIVLGILLKNRLVEIIEREVYVTDTVTITKDSIINHTYTKYVTQFDTIIQSIQETDTLYVPILLPIEHKVYEDNINHDTILYNLRIDYSGFKPSLDSIQIDSKYLKEETIITKPKPWRQSVSVGILLGYGISIQLQPTFTPYIGVGIQYGFGYTW